MLPFLNGKSDVIHGADDVVAWELDNRRAVRKGDWKIVLIPGRFGSGDWELFNIKNDPAERTNLGEVEPEKRTEMIAEWDKYAKNNGVIIEE